MTATLEQARAGRSIRRVNPGRMLMTAPRTLLSDGRTTSRRCRAVNRTSIGIPTAIWLLRTDSRHTHADAGEWWGIRRTGGPQ
jgi:hypothetical protein